MAIFKKEKTTKAAKPAVETSEVSTSSAKSGKTGAAHRVLVRPLLSEKTARDEKRGTYSFAVAMNATKTEIIRAVEQVYGVRPSSVRTLITEGKTARFGQNTGRRKNWKKAIITLPAGATISIHTGV